MNSIHLHLLLNHVPVIGAVLGVCLLAVAALRRSSELGKTALALFAVLAATAVAVFITGEPAEELVEKLPGFSETLMERHEEVAEVAMIAMIGVGVFSIASLLLFRKRALARWVSPVALALSVAATGIMGYAANLGGMIRHTEIRTSAGVVVPTDDSREHDSRGR
jgi:uncharacterized membrane protein